MKLRLLTESIMEGKSKREFSNTQFNMSIAGYNRTQGSPLPGLQAMGKNIDEADLAGKGLENEFHVTVLFGLHTQDPKDVEKIVKNFGTVLFELGKTTIFENDEFDVVKVSVKDTDGHLKKLNSLLKKLPYTNNYPDYVPHLTLAMVKCGAGKKYVGMDEADGHAIICHQLTFSPVDGAKTNIDLSKQIDYSNLLGLK